MESDRYSMLLGGPVYLLCASLYGALSMLSGLAVFLWIEHKKVIAVWF